MFARFTEALYNFFKLGPSQALRNLKNIYSNNAKGQCTVPSNFSIVNRSEYSVFNLQQFDGLKFLARLRSHPFSKVVNQTAHTVHAHLSFESPLSACNSSPLPKLSTSIFGRMVSRSMATVRPLSHIERKFIERSNLLPSIVNSLATLRFNMVTPVENSSVILTGLIQGDFLAKNPQEFLQMLEIYQKDIIAKLKGLKVFGERLRREDVEVTFALVDGKIAVKSEQELMKNTVVPRINIILPWSDGWKIANDGAKYPEPSATIVVDSLFPEKSNSLYSEKEDFIDLSLREQFPHLAFDELESFTAWSDAC